LLDSNSTSSVQVFFRLLLFLIFGLVAATNEPLELVSEGLCGGRLHHNREVGLIWILWIQTWRRCETLRLCPTGLLYTESVLN
jgi:hypothetical protein